MQITLQFINLKKEKINTCSQQKSNKLSIKKLSHHLFAKVCQDFNMINSPEDGTASPLFACLDDN